VRVLITGATGAVGPSVVRAFIERGDAVRVLLREGRSVAHRASSVHGDLLQPHTLPAAVADIDVIVHLAGLAHQTDIDGTHTPRYQAVNVEGTANLLRAAAAASVRRVVFCSSVAVYGSGSALLSEDSPARPETAYAASKLAAEQRVLDSARDGGPEGVVLRLAAVYGPSVKGNYRRLLAALASGRFIPVGRGRNRRTLVHEHDVAAAAVLTAVHRAAAGRVYNVSDGAVHTVHEIIGAMCRALGRTPPRLHVPVPAAQTLVSVAETVARATGTRPVLTRAALDKYTEDVAVTATRIQTELGFQPRTDLAPGWQHAVEAMRANGSLTTR
jgi:UDP-glucose 4-epimerase